MAKSSIIQQYARIGAAARIKEVQDEIAAIGHIFPDLATSSLARKRRSKARIKTSAASAASDPQEAETAVPASQRKRKRRKMSAAARKAISDAQKARWAKQKNTKA